MQNPFAGSGKAEIARRLPGVDAATVQDYVEDAWGKATGVVPIIAEDTWPPEGTPEKADAIKAILRAIILRWHEAQSGAITGQRQTAGPYAQSVQLDKRPTRGYTLMPYEAVDLQRVARRPGGMFSISTFDDTDAPRRTFANGPHPGESDGRFYI